MVGVKGLKPSTSRSQTARAINCATPRWCLLGRLYCILIYSASIFLVVKTLKYLYMMKQLQKHFLVILIISALAALFISFAIGFNQGVWFDEGYSLIIAKQSTAEMIRLTAVDVHPPLYYLLLQGWAHLFNDWNVWSRLLSAIFLGGAVFFSGLLSKKLFGKRTAIITLPFIVFCPLLLRYGFELRMYSLTALIGVAATYVLVCAIGDKKDKKQFALYIIYALLVAAGMYTHYYMALLWLAHFTWLIWKAKKDEQPIIKSLWFMSYMAAVILFIPWLPSFLHQFMGGVLASVVQPMTIENLIGVVSFIFVYKPVWQLGAALSLLVIFVFLILGIYIYQTYKRLDAKSKDGFMLIAMYTAVPLAILTIVGLVRPMYLERYLVPIIIGGLMVIGVAVSNMTEAKNVKNKLLAVSLFAVMMIGVCNLVQVGNYSFQRLENVRTTQAALSVNAIDCSTDIGIAIIAADPYTYIQFDNFFDNSGCPYYFYSQESKWGGGYAILSGSKWRVSDPAHQLDEYTKLYYIYYDEPKLQMPTDLIMVSKQKFGSVTVEKYDQY